MPRGPRIDIPGMVQHVICRGIERKEIFKSEDDYKELLSRLTKLAGAEDIKVYAFCLMPNHIHLLVRPLKMTLSSFMSRLLTGYAIYFNRKHKRAGHLFQNRYKSYVVEEDTYLLELIRYIHLNPVRAGIVPDITRLAVYPYTSYPTLMGRSNHPFVDKAEVLAYFSSRLKAARQRLAEFMKEGLSRTQQTDFAGGGFKRSLERLDPEERKERQAYDERILGSGFFVEAILKEIERKKDNRRKEVLLGDLLGKTATLYNLTIPELCSGSRRVPIPEARAVVVYFATKELGIKPKELAEILNVTAEAIYHLVRVNKGKLKSKAITLD